MTDSRQPPAEPGAPPVIHVDALPPGTRLDEFEVLSLLGVGGFGMVYRAYDHSLHRAVAIKEYMPSALAGRSDGLSVSVRASSDQPAFLAGLKSFVAEARLLARFDHPSLVKVYRFWEANHTAYMVMPLYSGMTFRQARQQMPSPPPEAWLRKVLWSILEALKVLHENNTVHRDVSPDNIFLQDIGPPVLLDLGAARRAISDKSQQHTAILKVNYAPIEQYAEADDLRQGPWTDLYSVAAVVHGCLCNEPPLPATSRVVRDRMPAFASVARTVEAHFGLAYSPGFVAAIGHALAVQPGERPQSVQEFADEMSLQAPDGMLKFEWRAGIPDLAARSNSTAPEPPAAPPFRLGATVDLELDWPSTLASDTVEAIAPASGNSHPSRKTGALVLGAVLLSGLAFLSLRTGTPAAGSAAPEAAEPAVNRAALPEPLADSNKAPETKPPKAALVGALPSGARKPAAAVKSARSEATQANATEVATGEPPPMTKSPVVDELKSAPTDELWPAATTGDRPPTELCADSNFFTRPMCIHLECQKPEFMALAVCVEDHRRYPGNSN